MGRADWFVDLGWEALQAYSEHYRREIEGLLDERGLEGTDLWLSQVAWARRPDPVTIDDVRSRVPYMAVREAERRLKCAVHHDLLEPAGRAFKLTPEGREVVDEIARLLLTAATRTGPPGSAANTAATAAIAPLRDVVGAAATAAAIPTPNLDASRKFDPGTDGPALEQWRRLMADLFAFRDDAHIAAWTVYGVTGYVWEAFSHIWGGNVWGDPVCTASELAAKLSHRGYHEDEYEQALDRLVARGWLSAEDDVYAPSVAGAKLRAAAEEATDELFFAPWALTDDEQADLRLRLEALLRILEESPA
ncbi:MAG: helix-turn-helix domain-containing protein [Anaerolineae bacterium]|jgi:hypothetical protein